MIRFLKNNKLAFTVFSVLFALYLWSTIVGFKLLKSEYGEEYKVGTHNGSIHHK